MNNHPNQKKTQNVKINYKLFQFNFNQFNYLMKKYNINKKEFIISTLDTYYNRDNIIEKNNNINDLYDLCCPICLNILKNPITCSSKKHSHNFCKNCIDEYLKNHNNCPVCKNIFEYKTNKNIENILSKLLFKCVFSKEGCNKIINYLSYFKHINECKFKNI
jgi:hypothetical protein